MSCRSVVHSIKIDLFCWNLYNQQILAINEVFIWLSTIEFGVNSTWTHHYRNLKIIVEKPTHVFCGGRTHVFCGGWWCDNFIFSMIHCVVDFLSYNNCLAVWILDFQLFPQFKLWCGRAAWNWINNSVLIQLEKNISYIYIQYTHI